jgi:hypothetical protein
MSAPSIQPTFPNFSGADGLPLENGYIWIGAANLDPQVNPINVYWDAALTISAPQPIRTLNGYASRSGTPANVYVNSDYSIRVQDSKGSSVYSNLFVSAFVTTGTLADGAVTTPKIADNSVTTPKIVDANVTTAKIADANITAGKLSGAQSGTAPIYAARAWVNFNGTGTVAILASGNVSSINDFGVGNYRANFITAMPDANYAAVCSASADVTSGSSGKGGIVFIHTFQVFGFLLSDPPNAGEVEIATTDNTQTPKDFIYVSVAIFR